MSIENKKIGLIGLGKMGAGLAWNLKEKGWDVIVYNRTTTVAQEFGQQGFNWAASVAELCQKLDGDGPRIIWLMIPAGPATVDNILGEQGLVKYLAPGDYIVDGGNSFYKDTMSIAEKLKDTGIHFMDSGTSGGPAGARHGACLMIGGLEADYQYLEPLYKDIAAADSYQFFAGNGAGHFTKMVHNGIEYGMMQALAEGFEVLKQSPFQLNLKDAARIYNNNSVITSRLTGWLLKAFEQHGQELEAMSAKVDHTGEGTWTVLAAKEENVAVPIIAGSLDFRMQSEQNPSYTGKVLTALRNQFGGHSMGTPAK